MIEKKKQKRRKFKVKYAKSVKLNNAEKANKFFLLQQMQSYYSKVIYFERINNSVKFYRFKSLCFGCFFFMYIFYLFTYFFCDYKNCCAFTKLYKIHKWTRNNACIERFSSKTNEILMWTDRSMFTLNWTATVTYEAWSPRKSWLSQMGVSK